MSKRRKKVGLPPGTIVFTGNKKVEKVFIHCVKYNEEKLTEDSFDNYKEIHFLPAVDDKVDWYDIRGIHDTELITLLGKAFQIHHLILEDITEVQQRPKFEEYPAGIFIVLKGLKLNKETHTIETEQVGVYFRKGLVLSFQETQSDLFESVRNRLKHEQGKIRQRGADYLAYAMIDVIVDNYLIVLEDIEMITDNLEDQLFKDPDESIKAKIHHLKRELLSFKKAVVPLREAIGRFAKAEGALIDSNTAIYLRDLQDHTIQVIDAVESSRDILNGLQDLFNSEVSYKMNQVIQILTLVSTIFIPLTFLAGIYGMNFDHMPELHWKYGYFILWGVMVLISFGLFVYFRRKKWI